MNIDLKPSMPFNFHSVVNSHGWVQVTPFEIIDEGPEFQYTLQLTNGRVTDLVVNGDTRGAYITLNGNYSADEITEITDRASWMLSLEQDFSDFYTAASQEPKLQHAQRDAKGRILRSPTVFEDVIKTILTTNTAWSGTKRMASNLVSEFGSPSESNPKHKAFPTPSAIARTTEDHLRNVVKLGYRSPYILEISQQVASGDLDLEFLKNTDMTTPELRKFLLSLKGVGAYAAANLLMILGRFDSIPIDSWAMKVVSHEWHGGEPIGKKEVEQAFDGWGEYKGLAFWFWDWEMFKQD